MDSPTREQVETALYAGAEEAHYDDVPGIDQMVDAVLALLAAHDQDHRVLATVTTEEHITPSPNDLGHAVTGSFVYVDLDAPPGTVVAVVTRPDTQEADDGC